MKKYLDINGLRILWGKITERLSLKVDCEDGKGLSANDYTTAEKQKLAGLENTVVDSSFSTSSENPVQNKVVASSISGINARLDYIDDHKANTTDLNTKVDKVSGKGLSTEDFTTAEKTKLAGLSDITVDSSFSTSSENPVQNKVVASSISGINARLDYIDDHKANTADLNTKVDKVSGKGLSTEDFTTAEKTKLAGLSDLAVDSQFSTSSENPVQNKVVASSISGINARLDYIDDHKANTTDLNTKVDKVSGKGLSTEDFTTAEKTKLAELSDITVDSSLSDSSSNPVQNRAVKAALDEKLSLADVDNGVYGSSSYPVSGEAVYEELTSAEKIPCADIINVEDMDIDTDIDLNSFVLYHTDKPIKYYYYNGRSDYYLAYHRPDLVSGSTALGFILKVECYSYKYVNITYADNIQTLTINGYTYRRTGHNSAMSSTWNWEKWYIVPDKEVPPATATTLGLVKPGKGIGVDDDGTIYTYSQKHAISYLLHGGTADNPIFYDENDTFTLNAPTKRGYTFTGWIGSNGRFPQTEVTIELGTDDDNLHFEAIYEPIVCYVAFESSGTEYSAALINFDATVSRPYPDPSKEGYTFDGWYRDGAPFDFNTPITGDTTITAHYTPISYTITYDLDGGSASSPITTYTIESQTFTLIKPTKQNYLFGGWTGSNGDSPQTEVTIPQGSTGNKSFTANWGSYEDFCYGFRIDRNDSNPSTRVTYMGLNRDFTPITSIYSSSLQKWVLNNSDWEDFFVIKGNYPVALNRNGSEDYKLDPNDLSKKLDGTASGYNSTSYNGLFMAALPKAYFYCYTTNDYNYCWICQNKLDDNFKAWAHINENGNEVDKFYVPLFAPYKSGSTIFNNANTSFYTSYPSDMYWNSITNIGSGWHPWDKSIHDYLTLMLILLCRSTKLANVFGNGRRILSSESTIQTGVTYKLGRFSRGIPSQSSPVMKAFFIEDLWGGMKKCIAGYISKYYTSKLYVKMAPPYTGTYQSPDDHTYVQDKPSGGDSGTGYIDKISIDNSYGIIPVSVNGSSTTYECSMVYNDSYGYAIKDETTKKYSYMIGNAFTTDQYYGQPCYRAPG